MEAVKILILEDSPEDVELIERAIRKEVPKIQLHIVDERKEFLQNLIEFKPDIILSDHALPTFNSEKALALCKKIYPDVPFVLVTGAITDEMAIQILQKGADDYVLKSNLVRLPSSIKHVLKQYRLKAGKELAEETLQKQNIMLKRVNHELDNFVYRASHDLRSPISSMLGLVNLMKVNRGDVQLGDACLAKMELSLHKLDGILKEVLDYSYNARLDIKNEWIDIQQIVNDCFKKFDHLEDYGKVSPLINIHQEKKLFCDPFRLQVIFQCLISNAITFMDRRKPSCHIMIDIKITETLSIVFEDNGIGIEDNMLPHVFEMFYRGCEKSQGAGLGLYIVKEVIIKLDGKIGIESRPRFGTKFIIVIPNNLTF